MSPQAMNNPLRVLLVDDNPDDRALAIRELRKRFPDLHVHEVCTAAQLEIAFKALDFDIVITDYQLGWSNGIAVLQAAKAARPDIPVIMFTATAQQEDAVAAMKAGLDEYVIKSIKHFVRLPVAVEAVLQHAQQRVALRNSERLAVLGRLTSSVVHEIRNPLESAQGLLYMIVQNEQTGDQVRQLAQSVAVELNHVQEIIGRTLNVSRESPAPVSVDLAKITDEILEFYRRQMELNHITVVKRYAVNSLVDGYVGEVRQIISNLLANALDAMGRNGVITIRTRRMRDLQGNEGVSYLICDTGAGIPWQYRQKVMQPFFTTKGEKGTGLGLWIVDEIVRRRGGTIAMRSNTRFSRSGTCFRIFLPIAVGRTHDANGRTSAADPLSD
jgi:signal transduction histidine kinase